MKNKPAILFLLPVLLLLTGSSLKAGATDRATTALAGYTWLADGTKYSSERPDGSIRAVTDGSTGELLETPDPLAEKCFRKIG